MCSSWRCRAPIRCHYTRCLRMPLAGGEGSCAQNQPRYSHSPYRSRAENIIRFERLGAVITSSHRDREKVLLFGSFYLEVAFVIVSLGARTGLIFFFYFFFFCFRFIFLVVWDFPCCCGTFCEEGAACAVHRECWLCVLAPACNICVDAKTRSPVQN